MPSTTPSRKPRSTAARLVFWSFLLGTLLLAVGAVQKFMHRPPAHLLLAAGGALQSMAIILYLAARTHRPNTGK